jgi:hypothetical protein
MVKGTILKPYQPFTQRSFKMKFEVLVGDAFEPHRRVASLCDEAGLYVVTRRGERVFFTGHAIERLCERFNLDSRASFVSLWTRVSNACEKGVVDLQRPSRDKRHDNVATFNVAGVGLRIDVSSKKVVTVIRDAA